MKSIKQWTILDCVPDVAYDAWMDSKKHGEMINAHAEIDPNVGGKFEIWDGEVLGKTLELDPKKNRIVQEWRYDYPDWPEDESSKIIVEFVAYQEGKCKLRFWQSKLPDKYALEIENGWKDYYWKPMKEYFSKNSS